MTETLRVMHTVMMSARESAEIVAAVATVALEPHASLNEIASRFGLARSTLTRALRRRGIAPRPTPRGAIQAAHIARAVKIPAP